MQISKGIVGIPKKVFQERMIISREGCRTFSRGASDLINALDLEEKEVENGTKNSCEG